MYPALAVGAAIGAAGAEAPRLVYVGSQGGMEEQIVARESRLPFRALPAGALRGRGPLQLLRGALTSAAGTLAAHALLRELRPAAILGTGGYVCVPLFLAARAQGVPTMVYLPDVVPGLAVRLLARLATAVAANVEASAPYLRLAVYDVQSEAQRLGGENPKTQIENRKLIVTGYPVRAALFNQDRAACRRAFDLDDSLPVLLVYGGSRGARSLNRAIEALLPELLEHCQLIHVCGREGDATWLRAAAERLPAGLQMRYKLFPYLESGDTVSGKVQAEDITLSNDIGLGQHGGKVGRENATVSPPSLVRVSMISAFGAAELAVCRSGASTLAELPAAGLPAVLVPYPYVHQEENADYLVQRGAAAMVPDAAMLGDGRPQDGALFRQIIRLLNDKHERQRMAEQSRALARPEAARYLAEMLLSLAARSGG